MKRSIQGLLCFLSVVLLFSSCRKNFEIYEEPPGLADPIYQQLQAKGNFNSILKVIDKAGYKQILSTAGFWTFFAPTDAAFESYIQTNNVGSVDNLTAEQAEAIVRYSLVYDAEKVKRLNDYFVPGGWNEDNAFRRRTVYYDFVYDGVDKSGKAIKVIDVNRNGDYSLLDFNNKHVPVYTDEFFSKRGLSSKDYEDFYPGSIYSKLNVGPASIDVSHMDIVAENGVIHVVDKVLTPPQNIGQYLRTNSNYTAFNELLDLYVTYKPEATISQRYRALSGKSDDVWVKFYNATSGNLLFSPTNENFAKISINDAQTDSWSAVIPNNDAISNYAKNTLLKYFPKGTTLNELYSLRPAVISTFINSHLFNTALWPSKFKDTDNGVGERLNLNEATDVTEKRALSNGFFYGTNKVQRANVFSTVYGPLFLDPKFTTFDNFVNAFNLHIPLKVPSINYGILPLSDAVLTSLGYSYDVFFPVPFRYNGSDARDRVRRVTEQHILDFTESPVVRNYSAGVGFLRTLGGEYIKYDNGYLISSGTLENTAPADRKVLIDSVKADPAEVANGAVVYPKTLLTYSEKNHGFQIEQYGRTVSDPFFRFFEYLKSSTLYTAGTTTAPIKSIAGMNPGGAFTILIPTNEAIDQAIRDRVLPGTVHPVTGVITYNYNPPADQVANIALIEKFLKYHILRGTIAPDGGQGSTVVKTFETFLLDPDGVPYKVNVIANNRDGTLRFRGISREASVVSPFTRTVLANKTVIHSIDNYLKY